MADIYGKLANYNQKLEDKGSSTVVPYVNIEGGSIDADITAIGAIDDAAVADPSDDGSVVALLKGLLQKFTGNGQLLSAVVTVTTAGAAVQGPDIDGHEFVLKAAAANTGIIYVGNDGADDVAVGTGYPLQPGEAVPVYCSNLSQVWFDSSVNGEKCAWLRIR